MATNPYAYDPAAMRAMPWAMAGGGGPGSGGPGGLQSMPMGGNPYMSQGGMPSSMEQYGYGNRPNQGGGYYEQGTPAGSFAAANQQYSQQGPGARQQRAGTSLAANPYIGQQSQGIQGVGGVSGNVRDFSNPYLGQQTRQAQASSNSMAGMNNPYLTQAIDQASADASRNYNQTIAPRRLAQMQASGSFGNTGVQEMQLEDQRNLQNTLGSIATNARMGDYNQQLQLAENAANRNTGVSQFNSAANAADLSRNLSGAQGQFGMNTGFGLDAGKFDASTGLNTQQFNSSLGSNDLSRNSSLMQGMGQYNSGALNAGSMFNAGQGNQMNQFNAQLGQQNNQFNAGQGNAMNMYNAGAGNSMLENYRNRTQQQGQFDANLDRSIYNDNMGWMRTGQQDQLNAVDRMLGWQGTGMNAANQQRQQPITDWASFSNVASQLGGLGGVTQQQFEANPWLGAIAGWMLGGRG